MDEYLTEMELAERLKMSRQALLALRKQGLPYRRANRAVRYVVSEVDEWMKAQCQVQGKQEEQSEEKSK